MAGGSGESGELADTEEDWWEDQGNQGSQGSYWLERFASLTAGAILDSRAAIGGSC